MPTSAAQILAQAIADHRDHKYHGQQVDDPNDAALYDALTWYETWRDHSSDPDAPILELPTSIWSWSPALSSSKPDAVPR